MKNASTQSVENEWRIAFGNRLRIKRTTLELSPATFAQLAGVTPTSLLKWEGGSGVPSPLELASIAAVMQVSADWLVGLSANERHYLSVASPEHLLRAAQDEATSLRQSNKTLTRAVRLRDAALRRVREMCRDRQSIRTVVLREAIQLPKVAR